MWNMKDLKNLKNLDKDDLLEYVGLETRRSTMDWMLPTLAVFGVGVLVGAGVGLLLAPKSGAELRDDLRSRLETGKDQLATNFPAAAGATERSPRSL